MGKAGRRPALAALLRGGIPPLRMAAGVVWEGAVFGCTLRLPALRLSTNLTAAPPPHLGKG